MAQFRPPATSRRRPRSHHARSSPGQGPARARSERATPYLKRVLGEDATAAAKTDTFLGERYRRLVRRQGKQKALVALERSILVAVWHLLADPNARFVDLGTDFYAGSTRSAARGTSSAN